MLLLILLSLGIVALLIYREYHRRTTTAQPSNYSLYSQEPYHQPDFYPLEQTVVSTVYRPIAPWVGRLILPEKKPFQSEDFAWIEVHCAPDQYHHLVGKVLPLQWLAIAKTKKYVQATTRNIAFSKTTRNGEKIGNVHPHRLNYRLLVGPLESLAGARPTDDVLVKIREPVVVEPIDPFKSGREANYRLLIAKEPIQITGRFYGLVSITRRIGGQLPDYFEVRHFNLRSRQFDGFREVIYIPQVPPDRGGLARSTNQGLEQSPLNGDGWYIYGAKNNDGVFVVQAIIPRTAVQVQPDRVVLGREGLTYVEHQNWRHLRSCKGTLSRTLIDLHSTHAAEAQAKWQEGDRAIVIHLYGGIGGEQGESPPLGIVTGHFSYGIARVIREPLADELQFQIEYRQVYAQNPDGIISGASTWENYLGDLQRGWLGNRPVSDILVRCDAITRDYDFSGIRLSPLTEFMNQLDIMMARYRVGDGTGAAIVTPAKSCVQDSNQALYIMIERLEEQIEANPQIRDWLRAHPNHPQTARFQELMSIGRSLKRQLKPFGLTRLDWQKNADAIAGTEPRSGALRALLAGFTTWRTMLPRRAHDEISNILLRHGASLWVIRTNQVGGNNPKITPYAPTFIWFL
ncbi:abortive infection protein [Oscillatoria sp. FACHB-1407]|uniref:abortive infection protein n=1 Tax=Oscillatoria sp. FACHB-1407 TaxID=2692847 RepID=UPI0016856E4B|nr:abortive infection protein [Oscillatoria sp. FACHB-1407]MBD2460721.1 abortive infection protein [Oscillatoria sp. FACHB-1407]